MLICNMLVVAFFIVSGFVHAQKKLLTHDTPLGKLMNTRIAKPGRGWFQTDFLLIGPINEFLSMSIMELLYFCVFLAWTMIAVYAKFRDLEDQTLSPVDWHDHARNFGRAMSQATLRCLLIALVSPNRNTVFFHLLGVPFERALRFHKIVGRLMVVCMIIHVLAMIIGGTERGLTPVTGIHTLLLLHSP